MILLVFGAAASLPVLPAAGADAQVTIQNTAFHPASVTVGVGEKVVWKNQDDASHTVTSNDNKFDSNPACPAVVLQDCLEKGESFAHTFDQAGEYEYYCKIHSSMTGVVLVQAAAVTTTTQAPTTTTLAPTTSSTAATTTTTRKLATSSTVPSSTTTSSTLPAESSTTLPNEAPAFDPDEGGGDGGSASPASSGGDGGGGSGTVALIVAALLAVAGGGGVLLWRLRPGQAGGPPAA